MGTTEIYCDLNLISFAKTLFPDKAVYKKVLGLQAQTYFGRVLILLMTGWFMQRWICLVMGYGFSYTGGKELFALLACFPGG